MDPRQNGARDYSRAERFEDEKKRIIDSCFGKKDVDGSLLETYITHIRIIEFSTHPTHPPPPDIRNTPAEKPRIIIVAVRKSGRVRMHKSKENSNGSFSIGKTWDLHDLSGIESYTGNSPQPGSSSDPQHREWAGETGFLVNIGKPYYWQAQTDKEKKFFIASLIKIFGKYTGGNTPELRGFDSRELEQVLGSRRPPPPQQQQPPPHHQNGLPPPRPSLSTGAPQKPPSSDSLPPPRSAASSSQISLAASNIKPYQPGSSPVRGPHPNGSTSPAPSGSSSRPGSQPGSQPAPLRRLNPGNKSQDSLAASYAAARSEDAPSMPIRPRADDSGSIPPRSRGGDSRSGSRPPPRPRPDDSGSRPPPSRGGDESAGSRPPRARAPIPPPGAFEKMSPGVSSPVDRTRTPPQVDLPDRRRPPMDPTRSIGADSDLVPAPLVSPGGRREQSQPREPPPRSSERSSPGKDSAARRMNAEASRATPPPKTGPPATASVDTPPLEPLAAPEAQSSANGTPFISAPSTPITEDPPKLEESKPAEAEDEETRPGLGPMIKSRRFQKDPPPEPQESAANEDESRPGLGPMIKGKKSQKELAGSLWKAASAVNAFKPRPGGAGERLRELKNKGTDGPDGMTSVVPAPPRPQPKPEPPKVVEPEKTPEPEPQNKEPANSHRTSVPEVKVTVTNSSRPTSMQASVKENQRRSAELAKKPEEPQRPVVTSNDARYLAALGVDTSILADTTPQFVGWLDHLSWVPGDKMRSCHVDDMKLEIDRELNKAQAGGWVARFQEEDERVEAIKKGLDVAITECEELDNLLTLYTVELSTLSDDIAYIEAQGQGLQVQAANQKLLHKEVESLLDTCAITRRDLQALSNSPLDSSLGVEEIEQALVTLYRAMLKIDSSTSGSDSRKSEDTTATENQSGLNTDYGRMRIVNEKKEMYRTESAMFLQRLQGFMAQQFDKAARDVKTVLDSALSKKVDPRHHDIGREGLYKYSPLILYAREADVDGWSQLLQVYQERNLPLYKSEFKFILDSWKKNARKPAGDEQDLLFTSQVEKQEQSTMATARKLTVKRSQTLARNLRSPLGEGAKAKVDKSSDGRSLPYEVFVAIADDLLPLVEMEQNFITDFFHATTLETSDFPDLVAAARPQNRRVGDLKRHRLMEPDRDLARRITRAMEMIFTFLEQELQNSVDWVLSQDPLQGVGVLAALERKHVEMTQSNQDFLNNVLHKIHSSLEHRFTKFVEEQIRAIEDIKVKIKKRKGVISFFRIFPNFSSAVENMLAGTDETSSVRRTVDREYERIIRSMFDSLKVIARENPATLTHNGADPEDKEALNYHILLIENMNHFVEEVDTRGLEVLEEWKQNAVDEMAEHMDLYIGAVMRRPLGKLLEYLENIEAQLASGKTPTAVASQPSNAKPTFNKVLAAYDAKEIRKGVEALRKRVEKHFTSDADEPSQHHHHVSRGLVNRVLRECEKFYGDVEVRISTITTTVYSGDVLFEWPRADVKSAFATTGR